MSCNINLIVGVDLQQLRNSLFDGRIQAIVSVQEVGQHLYKDITRKY